MYKAKRMNPQIESICRLVWESTCDPVGSTADLGSDLKILNFYWFKNNVSQKIPHNSFTMPRIIPSFLKLWQNQPSRKVIDIYRNPRLVPQQRHGLSRLSYGIDHLAAENTMGLAVGCWKKVNNWHLHTYLIGNLSHIAWKMRSLLTFFHWISLLVSHEQGEMLPL